VGIHRNRGLQEVLSRISGSSGGMVTGVGTGEPGCVDGGYGNYPAPGIKKKCQGFLEHSREEERRNLGHELVDGE